MHFDDYRHLDATELARLVREGEVSASETVAAAAEGIERLNPTLNAVIESWADEARDAVAAKPPTGPLAGVPFLLKDMVEWKGRQVTFGSRLLDGYLPPKTHPLARRYAETGLVAMGRTNMSELGLMPLTEPTVYGPTRNPWDHSRSPGGSSGGSAAAVAAGIVPVAHAADGGGSIRIPASACGLFGLKPTRGRTVEALHEVPDGFVIHHVVSRSVRDSARLLDLSGGPSPGSRWRPPARSRSSVDGSFVDATERDPRPLRVGVLRTDFVGQAIAPACRRAVDDAAYLLEDLGHGVEEVAPPFDGLAFRKAFSVLWAVGASFFLKQVRAELHTMPGLPAPVVRLLRLPGALEAALTLAQKLGHPLVEPLTLRLARHSDAMAPSDLWVVWQALNEASAQMASYFEGYDILLTSTLTSPPWAIGAYDGARASLDSVEEELFDYAGMTPVANTAGLPAMNVPLYRETTTRGTLPIGVQIVAAFAADDLLLSLAAQLERARPWPRLAP